jgi:beta-glucanase (GH16 family)
VSGLFTYTGAIGSGDPHDEVDIEFLGSDTTKMQTNFFVNGVGHQEQLIDLGFDAADDFHTYAFVWQRNSIEWFVDGKSVRKVTPATVTALPSHPGKVGAFIWVTTLTEWAGGFEYQGPTATAYDYISYTPVSHLQDPPPWTPPSIAPRSRAK